MSSILLVSHINAVPEVLCGDVIDVSEVFDVVVLGRNQEVQGDANFVCHRTEFVLVKFSQGNRRRGRTQARS